MSCLCLQTEKSSVLWFKEAPTGLKVIWNFSYRHKLHPHVLGLNDAPFSMMLQERVYFTPLSFSFQIWAASVVLFDWSLLLNVELCPSYLFLNVFFVKPVYVSLLLMFVLLLLLLLLSISSTVALYMTLLFDMHAPLSGHGGFLQLHSAYAINIYCLCSHNITRYKTA